MMFAGLSLYFPSVTATHIFIQKSLQFSEVEFLGQRIKATILVCGVTALDSPEGGYDYISFFFFKKFIFKIF